VRSTTELQQHYHLSRACRAGAGYCLPRRRMSRRGLRQDEIDRKNEATMTKATPPLSREERLAAQLRENLRRRKAQARRLETSPEADQAPLPKAPPSR